MIQWKHWDKANLKIKKCSICKADGVVKFCLVYPDPVPLNARSHLELDIEWTEKEGTEITLELASMAGAGQVRFDNADGPETRVFPGSIKTQVAIWGVTASNQDADVALQFKAHNDIIVEVKLTVKDPGHPTETDTLKALRQELATAAEPSEPSDAEKKNIWQHYDRMFTDAAAIGAALAGVNLPNLDIPFIAGFNQANIPQIKAQLADILQTGRNAEAKANAEAIRTKFVFEPFTGKWRGHWRQPNACQNTINACQDHDWRPTGQVAGQAHLRAQDVVMGTDSSDHLSQNAVPCLDGTPGTRDHSTYAMNLFNTNTGCIVGAVDTEPSANQQTSASKPDKHADVRAKRPHIGFMPRYGSLVWLAEEWRGSNSVNYSLFWEFRDHLPDGRPTYTILGYNFNWTEGNIKDLAGRAGQYQIYLDPAAMQEEMDFNLGRITPAHLNKEVFRRRLESLSAQTVDGWLNNADLTLDAAVRTYLERLRTFLHQWEALLTTTPISYDRHSFFLGGAPPDMFYTGAQEFLTMNYPGRWVAFNQTGHLRAIRDHADNNLPAGNIWRQINIIVHANPAGFIQMNLDAADTDSQVSANELQTASQGNNRRFPAMPDNHLNIRSEVFLRGCEIGQNANFLEQLSYAFGADNADDYQRPTVIAPKYFQYYWFWEMPVPGGNRTDGVEQFLEHKWQVAMPAGAQAYTVARGEAAFKAKYDQHYPAIPWRDALGRTSARYQGDFYSHYGRLTANPVVNLAQGQNPALTTRAEKLAFIRQTFPDFDAILQSQGFQESDFFLDAVRAGDQVNLTLDAHVVRINAAVLASLQHVFVITGNHINDPGTQFGPGEPTQQVRTWFKDNNQALGDLAEVLIHWRDNRWIVYDRANQRTFTVHRVPPPAGNVNQRNLQVALENWRPIVRVNNPGNAAENTAHQASINAQVPVNLLQTPVGVGQIAGGMISGPLLNLLRNNANLNIQQAPLIVPLTANNPVDFHVYLTDLNEILGFRIVAGQLHIFRQLHHAHPPETAADYYGRYDSGAANIQPLGQNVAWPNP